MKIKENVAGLCKKGKLRAAKNSIMRCGCHIFGIAETHDFVIRMSMILVYRLMLDIMYVGGCHRFMGIPALRRISPFPSICVLGW